jgi:hypothetical protein
MMAPFEFRLGCLFLEIVIAGLDPAIHQFRKAFREEQMDARVKPGHDEQ